MTQSNRCEVCRARPAAMAGIGLCFECWPGGPVTPPPCRRCGSTTDYYSSGLCRRCHVMAPQRVDSCSDCLAWGATRGKKWRCHACANWRAQRPLGDCQSCGRHLPIHPIGGCRLCCHQRTIVLHQGRRVTLAEANRDGQQLIFANMYKAAHQFATAPRDKNAPLGTFGPVSHRQLVLFLIPWDPHAAFKSGFPSPRDPVQAAALHRYVADYARRFGWSTASTEENQRGIRVLLGVQDTPGGPIRRSDVMQLSQISISARSVGNVLEEAGMLDEDRVPTIVRWFETQVAVLPEDMRRELGIWFDIKRNGRTIPPRFQARSIGTIRVELRRSMPALQNWARTHSSLREISRDDVRAVLPPSGAPRSGMIQGLRSIFRVLKGLQLVFVNPMTHLQVPTVDSGAPSGVDLSAVREALDSTDRIRAAVAALLAFHAVRMWQLCALQLTDVRDGRLYLEDRVILLADPVRQRLAAYLDERTTNFPNTINPHFFIHRWNHTYVKPVTPWWIRKRLGMSGQAIRQDRILDEAHATAGDLRQVCDLFGLSTSAALRYTSTVDRITEPEDITV